MNVLAIPSVFSRTFSGYHSVSSEEYSKVAGVSSPQLRCKEVTSLTQGPAEHLLCSKLSTGLSYDHCRQHTILPK